MEDIELPDPKYIYHPGLESGEDDLFLFAESGDVACPSCERLYTADQLRAAVLADREKRAQAAQGDHPPCKGENCGITRLDQEHSPECIAEHERACSGAELDTPGNRHPEFRYAGYKNQALQNGATADQKLAYEEGKRAQFTEASKPVQAEAPTEQGAMGCDYCLSPMYVGRKCKNCGREAWRAALATQPTASNAEREENPIETMERLGFMFALDEETREQADKLASALRGSRVNYQIEQAAADMLWKLSSALATQPTASNAGERGRKEALK